MIKHIVMWRFKEDKKTEMYEFLEKLQELYGVIEQLRSCEVGVNINSANLFDAVLVATFDSFEDLEKYKSDPRHVAVSSLCKSIRVERVCVDYEI